MQRQAALAGAALLAAAVALAVTADRRHGSSLPPPVGSYTALAGSSGIVADGRNSVCGVTVGPGTEGVAQPVLPCGARLYLSYRGTHVLTEVVDHGPVAPGREFDLTPALALRLGVTGVQRIEWSYAGSQ